LFVYNITKMGCMCPPGDAETQNINRKIDEDKNRQQRVINLLFLGAGGSGKSTLFKQLRLLYGDGLSQELRRGYTDNVWNNLIDEMKLLVKGNLEMAEESDEIKLCEEKTAELVLNISESHSLTAETAKLLQRTWADPGVQMTWKRRSELQVQESLGYFIKHVDRIAAPGYIPNKDDVLHVRAITTGITEADMTIKDRIFHIIDVGGQRSERRKWMSCFNEVTGLIFVVSLIAYNQVLYEDETTNRMKESLGLFRQTLSGKAGRNFKDSCVVLFFNKNDLYKEMIKTYPITKCFPEYKGELTELAQFNYIKKKYQEQVGSREIFVHRTCATDTETIKVIFTAVNLEIIKKALVVSGLWVEP